MPSASSIPSLRLSDIEAARHLLGNRLFVTPVQEWFGPTVDALGARSRIFLKLELFQRTGSFKPRGALLNMLNLPRDDLQRGVTAVSAGNHAIATAYAANLLGTTAKIVMFKTANPLRVELCRHYGAEVEFAEDAHQAFERVDRDRNRGAAARSSIRSRACARRWVPRPSATSSANQVPELDLVVVPIGGGGLCAGVSSALKLLQPSCKVIGVEPAGADSMYRSFAAGEPRSIERVDTIADSLGAPYTMPISFELCRRNVDELVLVSDDELRAAMRLLLQETKLAVEPAGAAAAAALLGPLRAQAVGKRAGIIVSGSNIDAAGFANHIAET